MDKAEKMSDKLAMRLSWYRAGVKVAQEALDEFEVDLNSGDPERVKRAEEWPNLPRGWKVKVRDETQEYRQEYWLDPLIEWAEKLRKLKA